ncbi:DNA methyltransferase [Spiroplasma chrysopicola]|uniref:Type II R/M system DNA methylase n=1 Tax=Spiroplasma chrysopicola DF-1 TaxID=1276227 RepID=R4UHN8_9MOLU|nr:DNA methyltransferase [Spiroplasma chrysopicola]AGM24846.1 type II R/M system DNA methylase [Spiroplasma chrysopicola DF-1]
MKKDATLIKLKNIQTNHIVNLPEDKTWKKYSRLWGDWMHRICSYVAMFSPALADHFINEYAPNEGDIVLDTFSGRGTTLLQARILNKKAYSVDLNPFAYVLTRAKAKSFREDEIISRVNKWELEYLKTKNSLLNLNCINQDLKVYYSDINLRQLLFIKKMYGEDFKNLSDEDNFILAITLGILHGPMKKSGESIYLSLHMSNHTSMSVNYVKNYALKHNLIKPEDNIFDKIRNRVRHILKKSKFYENKAEVKLGNALNISEYFNIVPKLVFTSPPYLNIINYTQQNWLKMWMLGFDTREDNKNLKLDDRHNINEYKNFMLQYLSNISEICNKDSTIILVIGDVKKSEKINYSFEKIWNDFKHLTDLKLIKIYEDNIQQKLKATNSMGTKSGKATRVDKIYVFKKNILQSHFR